MRLGRKKKAFSNEENKQCVLKIMLLQWKIGEVEKQK